MECIWMERVILIIMAPLPVFHLIYFSAMWYLWWKNTWYLESSKSEYLYPQWAMFGAYKQESLFSEYILQVFFIFYSFPLGFVFLFFNILKIFISYLTFWLYLGLHCSAWAFSSWGNQGLLSRCGAWASHLNGFPCCWAQVLGTWVQLLWPMGLVALRHVVFPDQG